MKEEAKATVNEHIKKAEAVEKMTVAGLIDSMFETTPHILEEQKAISNNSPLIRNGGTHDEDHGSNEYEGSNSRCNARRT